MYKMCIAPPLQLQAKVDKNVVFIKTTNSFLSITNSLSNITNSLSNIHVSTICRISNNY